MTYKLIPLVLCTFYCGLMALQMPIVMDETPATLTPSPKVMKCLIEEAQRAAAHKNAIVTMYQNAVYWNASAIVAGKRPIPDVFRDDVVGRIEELGYMFNKKLSLEYFFLLTAFPQFWNIVSINQSGNVYDVKNEVLRFANNGLVSSFENTFRFAIVDGDINGNYTIRVPDAVNITQSGWIRFDCKGKIIRYKMNVPRMRDLFAFTGRNVSDPTFRDETIKMICQVQSKACVGANQQYTSVDQCLEILNGKPTGQPDVFAVQDSVICRQFHVPLAISDPDIHCPHLGPSGGGVCVNHSLPDYYDGLYDLDIPESGNTDDECMKDWQECQELLANL